MLHTNTIVRLSCAALALCAALTVIPTMTTDLPAAGEVEKEGDAATMSSTDSGARFSDRFAADPHRPRYHFMPPANWMDDPNGTIFFEGRYHLFYQHNPHRVANNQWHWGHAASEDLVHWAHLPIALAPEPGSYDKDGCYSGCAVVNKGVPTLVYTGAQPTVQCLATSTDGMLTWQKHPANPVIVARPQGPELIGFNDPCAWQEDDTWYMALGSGIKGVGGAPLLYRSPDLIHWEYLHPLCVGNKDETGEMWEVPDFFPLGNKHVLLISAVGTTVYFVGTYRDCRFTPEVSGWTDFGRPYFYAARTLIDDQGRRIMWGWIREGRSDEAQREAGWAGVMSLPRVISLAPDGSLEMKPVPELAVLRGSHYCYVDVPVAPHTAGLLDEVRGDCLEILAEIDPSGAEEIGLKLRCSPDGEEETVIVYNCADQRLALDRSRCSLNPSRCSLLPEFDQDIHDCPLKLAPGEPLRLHIYLDRSVIEVFAGGQACLTGRIYPTRDDSLGVQIFARGGTARIKQLDVWEMKSIWD